MQTNRMFTGYIEAHEYVDLGLSVEWATMNVGASSPSDKGEVYAWGETKVRSGYMHGTEDSVTYGREMGCIAGNVKYDVARARWGEAWRMPTKEEIAELVDKCSWEWATLEDTTGYMVTGPNGNSIFLPVTGMLMGAPDEDGIEFGVYWSATPRKNNVYQTCTLHFTEQEFGWKWTEGGLSSHVRPVSGEVKLDNNSRSMEEIDAEEMSVSKTVGFFKTIWRVMCACGAIYLLWLGAKMIYENGVYAGSVLGGLFYLVMALCCLWLAK